MISKIYFDLDGVLADFDRGVWELLHLPPVEQGKGGPKTDDILFGAMKDYHDFYFHLEPIPGMVKVFRDIASKYPCEILTGIPKSKRGIYEAKQNKIDWCKAHLGKDVVVNAVLRMNKPYYAKDKSYILIDDYKKNIREWEEAGGSGILFTDAENLYKQIAELEKE